MLEDLDKVNWKQFESRINIAQWIRDLISYDENVRTRAEWDFYNVPLEAWPLVIPFFLEILQSPATSNKTTLLKFIQSTAEFPDIDVLGYILNKGKTAILGLAEAMHEIFLRGFPVYFRLLIDPGKTDPTLYADACVAVSLCRCSPLSANRLEKVVEGWLEALPTIPNFFLPLYTEVIIIRAFHILPESLATFYQPKDPSLFTPIQWKVLHTIAELDPIWDVQAEILNNDPDYEKVFWENRGDPFRYFYWVDSRMMEIGLPSTCDELVEFLKTQPMS